MKAYIRTYNLRPDGAKDCFTTVSAPVKSEPLAWQLLGLQATRSGYGSKIPTQYKILLNGKWRRVYSAIFSNIGTLYIGKLSDRLIVDIERA